MPEEAPRLPVSWDAALDAFETSGFVGEYFGKRFRRRFVATKHQEKAKFGAVVTTLEYETCLREV